MIKFKYLYRCKKCSKPLRKDEEYCAKCRRELRQSDKNEKAKQSNISEAPKKLNINEAPKKPTKCLICGNTPENDGLYCSYCLEKHILPRKSPYSEYDYIHDEDENKDQKKHKCINGAKVRSKHELKISSVLEVNGIEHIYEYPLFNRDIFEKNKAPIKPDFYLPEIKTKDGKIIKNVFLEHFGRDINYHNSKKDFEDDKDYEIKTHDKLPTYRDMGLTVICTSYKDVKNSNKSINEKIMYKIQNCQEGTVNYVDKNMLYPNHLEEFKKSLEKTEK